MKLKKVLTAFLFGMLGSLITIFIVLQLGLETESNVYGANKFNFFCIEFGVLMVTAVIIECVENTGAREVAIDGILSLILSWYLVHDGMPWLSINNSFSAVEAMIKPALILGIFSTILSTPVQKKFSGILDKEIG